MKTKTSRGAETRRRILDAAARLMQTNGVNGTSVDDVLTASSTGKSQFYHYFASKDALVKELISFHLAAMPAASEELLGSLDSLAGVHAWFERIVADFRDGVYSAGCPIGNLASELAAQNEDLRCELQATFSHWEQRLAAGLQIMRVAGVLRADANPEALAIFIVAAIEGALLLAKTERSIVALEATLSQLKAHLKQLSLGATQRAGAEAAPRQVTARKSAPPKRRLTTGFCP